MPLVGAWVLEVDLAWLAVVVGHLVAALFLDLVVLQTVVQILFLVVHQIAAAAAVVQVSVRLAFVAVSDQLANVAVAVLHPVAAVVTVAVATVVMGNFAVAET